MFRVEPFRVNPEPRETEERFFPASDITREEAVRVATFKFPKLSMLIKLVPLPDWKEAMAEVWVDVALTIRVGVVEGAEKDWT